MSRDLHEDGIVSAEEEALPCDSRFVMNINGLPPPNALITDPVKLSNGLGTNGRQNVNFPTTFSTLPVGTERVCGDWSVTLLNEIT